MITIGDIGFLCGLAMIGWSVWSMRPAPRGGLLIRRLVRAMVGLHRVGMVVTGLALLSLPMGGAWHGVFGALAVGTLGVQLVVRWRAMADRGGERRWTGFMRLWLIVLWTSVVGHMLIGLTPAIPLGLLGIHVLHLWRVRRAVCDGFLPLDLAGQRWPAWVAAVKAEGAGARIRRFAHRWRIPPG